MPQGYGRFVTVAQWQGRIKVCTGLGVVAPTWGQCYFSYDFLVIVIVKVIIFQVFQLQF